MEPATSTKLSKQLDDLLKKLKARTTAAGRAASEVPPTPSNSEENSRPPGVVSRFGDGDDHVHGENQGRDDSSRDDSSRDDQDPDDLDEEERPEIERLRQQQLQEVQTHVHTDTGDGQDFDPDEVHADVDTGIISEPAEADIPVPDSIELILIRHGESEWNVITPNKVRNYYLSNLLNKIQYSNIIDFVK